MLTSPVTVTLSGTAHSLPLVNQDNFGSVYMKKWALNELTLTIRHSRVGKLGPSQLQRHNVELRHKVWDAEGNVSSKVAYTVITALDSVAPADQAAVSTALNGFVNANSLAIAGWES